MDTSPPVHVHTAHVPLRWSDVDAAGYVNNARYFTYFEQARVEWLESTAEDWEQSRHVPMLAQASCDFRQPLPYPATLKIDVFADPPGKTSLKTYYEVRVADGDGSLYAQGEATLVWIDLDSERPHPLPEPFRASLPAPETSAEENR